jgi:uncharacterized membrane protein
MTDLHRFIGYAVPAGFVILALWALVTTLRNRPPNDWFWSFLAVLQVVIGIQVVAGGVLYLLGNRPSSEGPEWLHYVYGGLFPAFVLIGAHRFARSDRWREIPWIPFGVGALVCFGLTFRALQTGLGTA